MIWGFATATAVTAALIQLLVVPRLPRRSAPGADRPPDYRRLGGPLDAAVVSGTAGVAALGVWPALDPTHALLWWSYLAGGASLAWIDLRTTWLPRRLHQLVAAGMIAGVVGIGLDDVALVAIVVAGGAAGFVLFYAAWRVTGAMGFGDVRLAALVGAAAATGGAQMWTAGLLAGTALGAAWGLGHALVVRYRGGRAHFPYGPALWLGPVLATAISG